MDESVGVSPSTLILELTTLIFPLIPGDKGSRVASSAEVLSIAKTRPAKWAYRLRPRRLVLFLTDYKLEGKIFVTNHWSHILRLPETRATLLATTSIRRFRTHAKGRFRSHTSPFSMDVR